MPRPLSYAGPSSDQFAGTRCSNPGARPVDRGFRDLLKSRFNGRRAAWPEHAPGEGLDQPPRRVAGLRIVHIGHASVLIQAAGLNILADPVWSKRVSPLRFAGPKRTNPPGVAFAELPPIDVVLITHNHYDHLDLATLARLWADHRPRIIAPLGNDAIIRRRHPAIKAEARDWDDVVS